MEKYRNKDCIYESVCKNKCTSSCMRYIQFSRLLELSRLPKAYHKPIKLIPVEVDKEAYEELVDIKNNICEFVESGKNLYIASTTPGNAKTTWSAKLMLNYFDKVWPRSYDVTKGLFVYVPSFLLDIKNFDERPEYIDRIKDADLVIWDDIAVDKLTSFEHEQLLQFIDYRIQNGLSNIYTSNIVDFEQLKNFVGGRLASRVYNSARVINFVSLDFRAGGRL